MAGSKETAPGGKESLPERAARIYRNFNILGTLVMSGIAVVVPVGGAIFGTLAGINALQAGGGEVVRRHAKKSRLKKSGG